MMNRRGIVTAIGIGALSPVKALVGWLGKKPAWLYSTKAVEPDVALADAEFIDPQGFDCATVCRWFRLPDGTLAVAEDTVFARNEKRCEAYVDEVLVSHLANWPASA